MRPAFLPPIKVRPQRAVGLLVVAMAVVQLSAMLFSEPDTTGAYPPVWMAAVLVSAFLWVGLGIMAGEGSRAQGMFFGLTLFAFLGGMFLVLNWVAFTSGPLDCSSSISIPFVQFNRFAAGWECRFVFGSVGVLMDGLLVLGLAHFIAWSWDYAPWTAWLIRAAQVVAGIAALPLALLLLVGILLAKSIEFWQGQWQRLRARLRSSG
ncbi:MAG: hypothetical protein HYZ26_02495 [Chloroflexi bacterium]|nr:hypothetical protein [Chloroflexota bacterium]